MVGRRRSILQQSLSKGRNQSHEINKASTNNKVLKKKKKNKTKMLLFHFPATRHLNLIHFSTQSNLGST